MFHFKGVIAIFLGLQTLWPYWLKKPDFPDFGCSSGQVLSKTKSVTSHFFYISDITNSPSFNGKISRKKSMLEKFGAKVLKVVLLLENKISTFQNKASFIRENINNFYLEHASILDVKIRE